MSNEEKTIVILGEIKNLLASTQTDYCDTDEACRIIGVSNNRYLTQLYKNGLLPRYPRAEGYKYKKADCYKIAAALDNKSVVLEPITNKK